MNQITGSGQVKALDMLQNLFRSYGAIDKIDLKENYVNILGEYDSSEPLTCRVEKLE